MILDICFVVVFIMYLAVQIATAYYYSAGQMKKAFFQQECPVGRVLVTAFYLPAWIMKFIRAFVVYAIR